ncbi:MAG: hypothetical protein ACYTX0_42800 [Nostoc sp.]
MYDESLRFSGKIFSGLTINATSENQANRYMSQENSSLREAAPTRGFSFKDANANDFAQGKRFGSWEPGLLPLEGV